VSQLDSEYWRKFFWGLDRTGPMPIYAQISARIVEAIEQGSLPGGARIADETTLCRILAVSRATVTRPISDLVQRGLVVRHRGVGTQIVHSRQHDARPVAP